MPNQPPWRIAVFASGNGTNLQALIDACTNGEINGKVVAVISNQRYALSLTRAKDSGIETLVFESDKFSTRTALARAMTEALQQHDIQLICLAGFMIKIEGSLLRAFPNRIINIHPALLPAFGGKGMYGRKVHEAVLASKEKTSGATVHLVDELYDHGPILAQSSVPVEPDDTPDSLAARIHPVEHKLYVQVVRDICSGKINLDDVKQKAEKA
jgi:phosphoribosylglycinamide formyltransferase-1